MTTPVPQPPIDVGAGRQPAAALIRQWSHDALRPRLCMVTGSPASGKSRLVAALMTDRTFADRFNAFVPLRGMTALSAAWAMGEQLRLPAETPEVLLEALAADTRRATIVAPALDESGVLCDGAGAAEIVSALLQPMLELKHVRLLVEGRPETMAGLSAPADVVHLDSPEHTDHAAFTTWLRETAARMGQADPRALQAAAQYYPNAGLAELALRAGPGEDLAGRWLRLVPAHAWPAVEALASAHEELDQATWHAWTTALTGDPQRAWAAVTALLPIVRSAGNGHTLGCRPLREAVLRARTPQLAAQIGHALGRTMYGSMPRLQSGWPDWARAAPYPRRHLARHSVASGAAERLLADPGFLVHGDPPAVTGAVEAVRDRLPGRTAEAWRAAGAGLFSAGSAADRAALLRLGALLAADDALAARLVPFTAGAAWVPAWVRGRPEDEARGTWPGPVSALALGRGEHGEVLHCATIDGPVQALAAEDGSPVGRVPAKAGTATGLVPFGDAFLTLDTSGAFRVLKKAKDAESPLEKTLPALRAPAAGTPSALGGDRAGSLIVVGDRSGGLRAWRTGAEDPPETCDSGAGPVQAVTCLLGPEEERLVLFGGADGAVRMWHVGHDLLGEPVIGHPAAVSAVAAAAFPDGPAFAAGWVDGRVWFWDATRDEMVMSSLGFPIRALALGDDGTLYAAGSPGVVALRPGSARPRPPASN